MNPVVVSIHVAAVVVLVLTVLLQAGKGAGMGAAFGGSSGTVFGTRGPTTLISKITCGAAVVFMITSLSLALSQSGGGPKGSIMDDYQDAAPPPMASPAAAPEPAPAPAAEPAPGE
ncbi:MAG: preprotein translocase subunit SecG [Candidatus Adiutrix sp.]|jgi:preprotein translocase subunit SecG|nr:preprotein translocase subunit SecG [Candidatus Adiutrix sp.]